MDKPFLHEQFVCVDCETTGLDPEKDAIIEVAMARFSMNEIFESKEWLVDPECEVPEESIKIHSIRPEMLFGKPKIKELLPTIFSFIGNHIIVGHNIDFDIKLLTSAAKRAGIATSIDKNRTIDTVRLGRLYGESPSNSLEMLRRHFNIEDEGAHRAMSDVTVNIDVFRFLAKEYKSTKQIMKILEDPIRLKFMPLGPHKGRPLREVPLEWLRWAANKNFDQDLLFTIRSEIKRRKESSDFSSSTNPFSNL